MKTHATIGAKILSGSQSSLLKMAEEIAQTHHERWDGHGYFGLQGDQIPITGRIVSIADEFDALIHDRPYKKAKTVSAAVDILHRMVEENHIDRDCFELFLKEDVYQQYANVYLDKAQLDHVDKERYLH